MLNRLRLLPPPVIALLLQISAVLGTIGIALLASSLGLSVSMMALLFLCGLIAAALSHVLGLARWWLPIQLLFLPALGWTLTLDLSSNWFLAGFLILLTVYWSTFRTQVPLYLSSEKVWHALVELLPPPAPDKPVTFMDLGSGLGGVLDHLAKTRPDGRYFGVESAPFPFLWSWLRLYRKKNCSVAWGSLWDCDLSRYDVVFAYLSPVPMEQLWHKARKEMRPGSVFISSTFAIPEQSPHQEIQVDDMHRSTLLVWRM